MSNARIKHLTASVATALLSLATVAPVAAQTPPAVAQASGCDSQAGAGDLVVYSCPFVAREGVQRFRFAALFGGSHDDTKLSLKATLDGAPVACAPGSKASSMYEDGDISLDCRIELKAPAGTRHVLAVRVQWYHAQLLGVQFTPE